MVLIILTHFVKRDLLLNLISKDRIENVKCINRYKLYYINIKNILESNDVINMKSLTKSCKYLLTLCVWNITYYIKRYSR